MSCAFPRLFSTPTLLVSASFFRLYLPCVTYPLTPSSPKPSSGRVLNRFSRDTDIMDATLSQSLAQFSGCIAVLICNIIVIAIATKWFAIAIPPIAVVYFFIQR